MPRYNTQPDIIAEIARHSKRLRHLERVNQMPASSVTRADGTVVTMPELAEGVATVTRDGNVPATAPVVTFIGGIGALFFRWTTVPNNSPITYRLHVAAGTTPTTDGTYEVAAGVGITFATVRKLADGTDIVGDGSVVYHAIVTAEDADGRGPDSTEVTGVPAQVTSADIAVNAVTADMLVANGAFIGALNVVDLTGTTMTGVTFRTRDEATPGGVVMGVQDVKEGLWVYDNAGNPFLTAEPSSGMAVVAGEVKATTVTVSNGSSLGGRTELTRATDGSPGKLVLTAGTTPPASAPTVTQNHDTLQFTNDGKWPNRNGWAYDGTYYYTYNSSTFKLEKWSAAGALVAQSASTGSSAIICYGLVCPKPNEIDMLYADTRINASGYLLFQYDTSTMAYVGSFNLPAGTFAGTRRPTIGWDAAGSGGVGDYILAQSRSTNGDKIRFSRVNYTTLAAVSSLDTTTAYSQDLGGVYYGAGDFSGNRYVTKSKFGQHGFVTYDTSGVQQTGETWPTGLSSGVTSPGFVWTGTTFKAIDNTGLLRTFTWIWSTTAANMIKWVSNTLVLQSRPVTVNITNTQTAFSFTPLAITANDVGGLLSGSGIPTNTTIATVNSTAGTGTLSAAATATTIGLTATLAREIETDQSPRTKFPMSNRYRLAVNTSPINSGGTNAPDRTYIYVGQGATDPGPAQMARQTDAVFSTGPPSQTFNSLFAPPGSYQPPAVNEFTELGGTVQQLVLADGTIALDGKGGGALGWAITNPDPKVAWFQSTSAASVANTTFALVTGWSDVTGYTDHSFCTIPGGSGSPAGTSTILTAGTYDVNATVSVATSGTGRRLVAIYVNGAEVRRADVGVGGLSGSVGVIHTMYLAASDQVAVYIWQNSGTAINLTYHHDFQITKR